MKNIFKQIKQYIFDHKDYFIRCTFNAVILGVIIGIVCAIFPVSSSAEASSAPTDLMADDPDQVIIPAGTYQWLDNPSQPLGFTIPLSGTLPELSILDTTFSPIINSISATYDTSLDGGSIVIMYNVSFAGESSNLICYTDRLGWNAAQKVAPDSGIPAGYGKIFTISQPVTVDTSFNDWFSSNTDLIDSSTATISAGTYFGVEYPSSGSFNVSFSFLSNDTSFDTFYVGTDYITYRMLTGDVRSVNAFNFASDLWTINYETIIVPTDQNLPADFVTWFNSNYTRQITPDPGPTYTISAGYYKARDTFTISGWNVSNDSIRIRYYNDASNVQMYEVVDGISFLVENDAAEIYYADTSVFTYGWNIDGAKNIQVMQDVTVGSDFYTVFNSVYAPSSESSNEFDSGYAAGYVDGRSEGYDSGYRQGYAQGLADGDTNIFVDIIGGTLAAVDSFTIFGGFSLLDLISTLLGGMALVWILKLLAGG